MFCPCCMEEFSAEFEVCPDCEIPLLDGLPRLTSFCGCDDGPIGQHIALLHECENPNAGAIVFDLTHLTGDAFTVYFEKLLAYNSVR